MLVATVMRSFLVVWCSFPEGTLAVRDVSVSSVDGSGK